MRKLMTICFGLVMIISIAGCSAAVGPSGAGVSIGYSDTNRSVV